MAAELASRRDFLGAGALVVLGAAGCNKRDFACTDTRGLGEAELAARAAAAYVDRTSNAQRTCERCRHWLAKGAGQCGGCKLFPGPVHPLGTCKLFAPMG